MSDLALLLLAASAVALALPLGALVAAHANLGHGPIASIMSAGAGLLLAALVLGLFVKASDALGAPVAMAAILAGALLFSAVNLWLASREAQHRKRCATCRDDVGAPKANGNGSGGGLPIAVGTAVDAVPEAMILGSFAASGHSVLQIAAVLCLGNLSQSISATSGLRHAGWSSTHLWGLWFGVAAMVIVIAFGSFMLLGDASEATIGLVKAVSAGLLLAMVAEVMLPEAVHDGPRLSGFTVALGFGLFAAVLAGI